MYKCFTYLLSSAWTVAVAERFRYRVVSVDVPRPRCLRRDRGEAADRGLVPTGGRRYRLRVSLDFGAARPFRRRPPFRRAAIFAVHLPRNGVRRHRPGHLRDGCSRRRRPQRDDLVPPTRRRRAAGWVVRRAVERTRLHAVLAALRPTGASSPRRTCHRLVRRSSTIGRSRRGTEVRHRLFRDGPGELWDRLLPRRRRRRRSNWTLHSHGQSTPFVASEMKLWPNFIAIIITPYRNNAAYCYRWSSAVLHYITLHLTQTTWPINTQTRHADRQKDSVSVCLLDTFLSPAKTIWIDRDAVGWGTRGGQGRNHVLHEVQITQRQGPIFGGCPAPVKALRVTAAVCTAKRSIAQTTPCTW